MKSIFYPFNKKQIYVNSLILLTGFILFSSSLFAQSEPSSGTKLHFGLKAQPSFAWLKAKDPLPPAIDGDGAKLGFAFGLMTEFSFSKNYSFATGLDVSYRGGKLKRFSVDTLPTGTVGDSLRTITSSNYTLQYLEIPLTLKMKTNEIGYFTYFGQFGIAPGINLSSKADIHTENQATNGQLHEKALPTGINATSDVEGQDVKSDINSFNLALIISLGFEYSLGGSTTAVVAATFNNGFLDVLASKNNKGQSEKAVSNTLGLTIGILF